MRYERNGCYSSSNNPNARGFQTNYVYSKLKHNYFDYFSKLLKLEKHGSIVDSDLEIYAKHIKNLS